MSVKHYRELLAWQKAMDLADAVHRATTGAAVPPELARMAQETCIVVAASIAEGHGRSAARDFIGHLRVARGALQQVETCLILAQRLDVISQGQLDEMLHLSDEVGRLTTGLVKALRRRTLGGPPRRPDDRDSGDPMTE